MTILFYTLFNLTVNFFMASLLFAVLNDAYAITNRNFHDDESRFWLKFFRAPLTIAQRILKKRDDDSNNTKKKKKKVVKRTNKQKMFYG